MKIRAIGTVCYAVHRKYVREKITGGRIIVCRIRSYENIGGRVYPILKQVGSRMEVSSVSHRIFHKLEDAILSITIKKSKK